MKYDKDKDEDIFRHLAMCVRRLSKEYPKDDIYKIMIQIAKNKTDKQRWNEPLIY